MYVEKLFNQTSKMRGSGTSRRLRIYYVDDRCTMIYMNTCTLLYAFSCSFSCLQHTQAILYGFASLLPFFLPWQKDGRADVNFLRREFGDMEVPVRRLCNIYTRYSAVRGTPQDVCFSSLRSSSNSTRWADLDESHMTSRPFPTSIGNFKCGPHKINNPERICAHGAAGRGVLVLRRIRRGEAHDHDST